MGVVQKIRCRVEKITDHGDRVYTVDLKPQSLIPRFRPGQFLHLALDEYDPSNFWPESRVFSIASPPQEREQIRLAYSVRGKFTARMEKELDTGRVVWVKMPYGDFVIPGNSDAVLNAGGTGITAFIAFLTGLTFQFPHQVYLAYGARSRNLFIFQDQIQTQARRLPMLRCLYFIEGERNKPEEPFGLASEFPGMISVETLWLQIMNPGRATYFLSGPPSMVKTVSRELKDHGISAEAIRIDAWE
jgi:ferredoxin-NADP reductase